MNTAAIGILDSGLGGLTVMREIMKLLPFEDIVYFGDTARAPYGNKDPITISHYALDNIDFFKDKNIKLLVIACHTIATALSEQAVLNHPFLIVKISLPDLETVPSEGRFALLGTKATIHSKIYQKMLKDKLPQATILPIACPLFVPLIENNYLSNPIAKLIVEEHLSSLPRPLDGAILACTHYPLLQDLITQSLGPYTQILDPALTCAKAVQRTLSDEGLLQKKTRAPSHTFYVSQSPLLFQTVGELFLKSSLQKVSCIPKQTALT